ncbi:glycosyltransferase family 4 protein [bacterium]|nr:glycosyltransferase family 4 protein [bacterium]
MNIAEITTYKEGGAYTHVVELIKKLNGEIIILTGNTKKSGFHEEDGNLYYHLPKVKSLWEVFFVNPPGAYNEAEDLLIKRNVDIVHFHSPLFTFLHGFLKKKKFPVIMTCHYLLDIKSSGASSFYRWFIKKLTIYVGKNVDKIICVNEDYISIFKKWGVDSKKLIYIPNGVDTKRFSPGLSKIKAKYKDQKIVLYFGRLHYQKNVDLLIRSFKYVKEKIDKVKLVIIGTGNQYEKLKKMSTNDSDIIMTGFISDEDLVDYMRASDIVVFPSRGENASFTIMEAMACELPVVSSDVGNAKKILGDGRGILLEKYTENEIADICIDILSNEKKADKIGKEAHKYVEENHSWDKISKKTEELYNQIIAGSKIT